MTIRSDEAAAMLADVDSVVAKSSSRGFIAPRRSS
jgi:hypothetical protein